MVPSRPARARWPAPSPLRGAWRLALAGLALLAVLPAHAQDEPALIKPLASRSLLLDGETGAGKRVVRQLMEPRVPTGLFDRPKRGFNLPIRRWVRRRPELLRSALDRLADAGLIRRPRASGFTGEQAWALMSLDRWMTSSGAL